MRKITMLAGLLLVAACSFGKEIGPANAAVDDFHKAYNAGQIQQLYDASGNQMKQVTTFEAFAKLMRAVQDRLGKFKSGNTVGWNENVNPAGTFVVINYAATYERGQANEIFTFNVAGDKPTLMGININSPALMYDPDKDAPKAASSATPGELGNRE